MSYFDQPPEFLGEIPLPEAIETSDPGVLTLKANGDHTHDFLLGGPSTTWLPLLLGPFCSNFGGGFRSASYVSLGNTVWIRGVVAISGAAGFPVLLASVPADLAPNETEMGIGFGFGGTYRIDMSTTGNLSIVTSTGGTANPAYLTFGAPYFTYCVD